MQNLTIDPQQRLELRARPQGEPVIHQRWDDLLFLHWPCDPEALRPLVPAALDMDTFEGEAWIGITPFRVEDLRFGPLPPVPGFNSFDEINVRTYVLHNGVPGIWFFSLDASKLVATLAARLFFMLPYFHAETDFQRNTQRFSFFSRRSSPERAQFRSAWRTGNRLRDPDVHSLAFFLLERYCYFTLENGDVFQTRIYHHPWILEEAEVEDLSSTMINVLGIPEPAGTPLAHFSRALPVDIWSPARSGG